MTYPTRLRILLVAGIAACLFATRPAGAAEEAWRFLEGLRERGYHDMAVEYLNRMRQSRLCPDDLREQIDYQLGVTLVASSRTAGSLREQQLDQAQAAFGRFLKEHPNHELAPEANTQMANVLFEQGRFKVALASGPSKSEKEKQALLADARALYGRAQKVFVDAERRIYERARVLRQEAQKDPRQEEARDACYQDLIDVRLVLAAVEHEIGRTYPPGSEQYKSHLTEAAKKYNALYNDYQKWGGGLYARIHEARVSKDLGQTDKAVKILTELRALIEDDPGARNLFNETLALLLEIYGLPDVKKYNEAIAEADKWTSDARGAEEATEVGLRIHFMAGKAALALAESIEKDGSERRAAVKAARGHLQYVTRFDGEFRQDARNLLTREILGGEADAPPQTFAEAKDRGDFAWATMVAARGSMLGAPDKQERDKAAVEFEEARRQALRHYHAALGLAAGDTPLEQLNLIRSYLVYLYFFGNDFHRAAVAGEFLARRYPQAAGASKAAEIAIKAYRSLYLLSPHRKEDRTFEVRRMTSLGEYIGTRWPGQPEANEAWKTLLDTAIDNRDVEKAEAYLAKLDPDSPQRAEGELRTGQALWATYLEKSKLEEDRPPQEQQLDALVAEAQKTLEQGVTRMGKLVDEGGPVTYTLAYSVLSLANICIGAGESEQAVQWLEAPKFGPLTLVRDDHPAADRENFHVETYKAALRAYVGVEDLDKAQEAMDALEDEVAARDDAEGAKKLTEIYYSLGVELQETLKRLRQEKKTEEAGQVVAGFEKFLDRVSERGEDFKSLNWVAATYFNLGASLDPGEGPVPPEAAKHYTASAKNYMKIIEEMRKNKDFAPPGATVTGIQVRLAVTLRGLDQHAEAIKILAQLLQQNERRVDVQVEAARTLQDWAGMRGQASKYESAIQGAKVGGQYLIWGWSGIARRVEPFKQHEATFHEARYNVAVCRMKLALTLSGEKKNAALDRAEQDIVRTYLLYPNMGGEEWYDRYDTLLKTIQRHRGRSPTGLAQLGAAQK